MIKTPRRMIPLVGCGLLLLCMLTMNASAQNTVVVKNDRLPDNLVGWSGTLGIVGAFNFAEEANVWLTTPCDGNIIAIEILWYSGGFSGPTVEQELGLFEEGTCDPIFGTLNRSNTALVQPGWGDVVFFGPQFTAGANGTANVISFQHVDENQTISMSVPVTAEQTFVVSLTFGTDWCADFCTGGCSVCDPFFGATIVHDAMGCTDCRNGLFGPPAGNDFCDIGISGNIIFRVIVECISGDGACCLPDGTCQLLSDADCSTANGVFQGVATDCAEVSCSPLVGACCNISGCNDLTLAQCDIVGGTWLGADELCIFGDPCGITTTGACCMADDSCFAAPLTGPDCTSAGGVWQGANTSCDFISCVPLGACCMPDFSCFATQLSESDCTNAGGNWQGEGTTCATISCIPVGACCFSNGFCIGNLSEADCLSTSGTTWNGADTVCIDSACVAPPPPCPGDCSPPGGDGVVSVVDLLNLLTNWGTSQGCDIDPPGGDGTISTGDLLVLLTNWGPCP